MTNLFFYWLIIGLIFLMAELINPGLFFFFSFFIGASGVAFLSLLSNSLTVQMSAFCLVSLIAFMVLCWLFRTNQATIYGNKYRTNMYALLGKRAVVIAEIVPGARGQIKVDGEIWSAQSHDNARYKEGSLVEIIDVIGCHCIVKIL